MGKVVKNCKKYKITSLKDVGQWNFVKLFDIIDYSGATPISHRMRKQSQTRAYLKIISHYFVCSQWPSEVKILSPNILLHQIQRYLRFFLRGGNVSHIANVIILFPSLIQHICPMRKIVNSKITHGIFFFIT